VGFDGVSEQLARSASAAMAINVLMEVAQASLDRRR